MITKPTVLVLGAGASQPYGFPLGAALVDQICADILDVNPQDVPAGELPTMALRLRDMGCSPADITRFAYDLRNARPYSVDAFLEARSGFRDVGKAAIADVLLRAEESSTVATAPATVDWYRYLLNRILLLKNPDYFKAQAHRLTIITFNFDRSFEGALYSTIRATFGLEAKAAFSLAKELQIHHIHGLLGELAEAAFLWGDAADTGVYWSPDDGNCKMTRQIAVRSIKIVDEEIEQSVVDDAQAALKKASFVYFLGFGFDERNLEKLNIPDCIPTTAVIRATAFGLTEKEQSPIVRRFGAANIRLHAVDALTFLRSHAESLFD